jgi:hypothetical protein
VHGVVRNARGGFAVGVSVRAVDVDLRHEQKLGKESVTNARGEYSIDFMRADFAKAESDSADLIVRAYSRIGELLASSPTLFNAPADAVIDLVIGGETYLGPSQFEQLVARVRPVLDGVKPQDLTQTDIDFLTEETGLPADQISDYALASSMASTTAIPVDAFYGLLRESLPFPASALATRPQSVLAAALSDAIKQNFIPTHDDAWQKDVLAKLQTAATEGLVGADSGSLKPMMTAVGVPDATQQAFAQAYIAGGPVEQMWSGLTQTIGAKAVDQLQTSLQWAMTTLNHAPLAAQLSKQLARPSDVGGFTLIKWRQNLDQLAASGQPAVPDRVQAATEDQRRSFYAQQLFTFAQQAFPVTALAAQLQGSSFKQAALAKTYLAANPDWDMSTMPVLAWLANHPADIQTAEAVAQVQRVHRVTAQPDWSVKLLENNLTSAQAIARTSAARIAQITGAPSADADAIRKKAQAIVDTGAIIHARFSPLHNRPVLPAVPQLDKAVEAQLPAYQEANGKPALCSCDECSGVLGPAAYLVDLFQFVGDKAYPELHALRPDLEGIELSCTNTLTPLPLIDLVNELLEDKVAGRSPTARQTTWSAADLAANPEHLDVDAYAPLKKAIYPWTLPFDLPLEEARIYLQHLGVSRFEVMQTLTSIPPPPPSPPPAPQPVPDETTLMIELLGMTKTEWDDIANTGGAADWSGSTPPDPVPADNALVEDVLQRSGLSAADLPALLQTNFVNSGSPPVSINVSDGLCDPTSATFQHLTAALDPLRKLVRLQRRLGWTYAEIDAALSRLTLPLNDSDSTKNSATMVKLARVERIRRATGLSVTELLSWWSPLPTTARADGISPYDAVFVARAGASASNTTDALALDPATSQPHAGGTLGGSLPPIIAARLRDSAP